MKRLKIAFISQPWTFVLPPGGALGIIVYEMAHRLAKSCDVSVYCRGDRFRKTKKTVEGVRYNFIPMAPDRWLLRLLERFPISRNGRFPLFASKLYYLCYGIRTALSLKAEGCDIVHILNFSQFVPIVRIFNPSTRIVLHMQCEWLTQIDQEKIEGRLGKLDLIIGCSDYITNKICSCFPQFSDRCRTVFNGVDINHFKSKNRNTTKGRNAIAKLLFVGRASPEKGLHILIDAMPRVVERFPDVRLDIIGSKRQLPFEYLVALSDDERVMELASFYEQEHPLQYYRYCERRAEDLGICKNINFLDPVPHDQLIEYLHNADMLILPSLSEAFGIPVVEAMASGVPVIASRVGGMTELVGNSKAGLLVDPGDSSALGNAIVTLLADDQVRKQMAEEGHKRATETFLWDQIVENLSGCFESLYETL